MINGYTNLYINGCSFTKGDTLKGNHAFPLKLSILLDTDLYDYSKNGNSLETIVFSSIHHLVQFDPKDTLVVIGLTWAPRSGILFNDRMFNITPSDYGKKTNKVDFRDKNLPGRFTTPFDNIVNAGVKEAQYENQEAVDNVLTSYTRYRLNCIKYDPQYKYTDTKKYIFNFLNLQNFLKLNNFTYLFVDFSGVVTLEGMSSNLFSKIDMERVIPMYKNLYPEFSIDPLTSHPTANATSFLAEYISNIIKTKL